LSDDEQSEVEKVANESINKLYKKFNGQNKKHLIELLEESFYDLLSRTPRFIRTSSKIFIAYCMNMFYLLAQRLFIINIFRLQ